MEENLRILKPFVRGFPIIILSMVLAVIVAKKYLTYVEPKYQSHIVLKLADIGEGIPSSNLFKDFDVFANSNKIAAEIEVLKSSNLINKTLDKLDFDYVVERIGQIKTTKLYKNSPFLITYHLSQDYYDEDFGLIFITDSTYSLTIPGELEPVRGTTGEPLVFKDGFVRIILNKDLIQKKPDINILGNYKVQFKSREKMVKDILADIMVTSADKDVAILRVSYKSYDPQKSADFVNALAHTYIEDYISTKHSAAQVTVDFLNKQINHIYAKLKQSEDSIRTYRDDNQIYNMRQETETELRKLAQLKIQATNEKMNLDAMKQIRDNLENNKNDFFAVMPHLSTFSDLLSTQLIKTLKELEAKRDELLMTYTEKDEKVIAIDDQIKDLKEHIVQSVENSYQSMKLKLEMLEADIKTIEESFVNIPDKERMMTIFEREFNIYQHTYNYLNEKKIEAEILQAANIAFHRIITPAVASKSPVSPNKGLIVIVAAMLGMFASIMLIYIVHLMKAKVNDEQSIEKNSVIPVALQTPRFKKKTEVQDFFVKQAIHLELKNLVDEGKKVLVVTSYNEKEGRAFHAENLSKAFAEQGKKVLLITDNQMSVMGAGDTEFKGEPFGKYQKEFISKNSIKAWISGIKKDYDLVVVDNKPVVEQGISLLVMGIADTNLFVVDSRKTPVKRIVDIELLKDEYAFENVYFVLNRAGYNPNVLIYSYEYLMKEINRLKQNLNRKNETFKTV